MSRSLADAAFWLAVVLCAVAQLMILRSALVARPAPVDRLVPSARRPVEVLWAVVPAIVLAVVLVLTWRAMHPAADSHPAAPAETGSVALAGVREPGPRAESREPRAESRLSHGMHR